MSPRSASSGSGLAVARALWHRLLGRAASESGRLCHVDGAESRGPRLNPRVDPVELLHVMLESA